MTTPNSSQPTRTIVNARFLLVSAAILSCLLVLAVVWNRFQVRRMAGHLLDSAQKLEKQQNWSEALSLVTQYLRLFPKDVKAQIMQAGIYDRVAQDPSSKLRVLALYDAALGLLDEQDSRRNELRLRQMELQLDVAPYDAPRYVLAERHACEFLEIDPTRELKGDRRNPDDPKFGEWTSSLDSLDSNAGVDKLTAVQVLALSLVAQTQIGDVAVPPATVREVLRTTLRIDPANPRVVTAVAAFMHENPATDENPTAVEQGPSLAPDDIILNMLAHVYGPEISTPHEPGSFAESIKNRQLPAIRGIGAADSGEVSKAAALLLAYQYAIHYNRLTADRFIGDAVALDGADFDTRMAAGVHWLKKCSTAGLAEEAKHASAKEAAQHAGKARELAPARAEPYLLLADALTVQGDLDAAIAALRDGIRSTQSDPWNLKIALGERLVDSAQAKKDLKQTSASADELLAESAKIANQLKELVNSGDRAATVEGRLARSAAVALLEGRRLFVAGNADAAIEALAPAVLDSGTSTDPNRVLQRVNALILQGLCYRLVGQWDRAAGAFESAAAVQPDEPSHRFLAAEARATSGQHAAAIRQLQVAINAMSASKPEDAGRAAISLLNSQWQIFKREIAFKPPPERIRELTAELARAIALAEQYHPEFELVELTLLKAEMLLSGKLPDEIAALPRWSRTPEDMLVEVEKAIRSKKSSQGDGDSSTVVSHRHWASIYQLYQQSGRSADAARVLDDWAKVPGSEFTIAVARVERALDESQWDQARKLLDQLKSLPESSTPDQKSAVRRMEADFILRKGYATSGESDSSPDALSDADLSELSGLAASSEGDLRILEQLHNELLRSVSLRIEERGSVAPKQSRTAPNFDQIDDDENDLGNQLLKKAIACENDIQASEGALGTLAMYRRAWRLLVTSAAPYHNADRRLMMDEVLRIQQQIEQVRPDWAPTYVLAAGHARADGTHYAVVASCERAQSLGDQSVAVDCWLIDAYRATRQPEKALVHSQRLGELSPSSPDLVPIKIAIAAESGNLAAAVTEAANYVVARPEDIDSKIQLARLRYRSGDAENIREGDAGLQEAIKSHRTDGRLWTALVAGQIATGRADDARKTVGVLATVKGIPDGQRNLLLGQCHAMIPGEKEKAKSFFAKALVALPEDVPAHENYAQFLVNQYGADGVDELGRLYGTPVGRTSNGVRRALAWAMAQRGDPSRDEVISLLSDKGGDKDDKRMRAILLTRTGQFAKARGLVEELMTAESIPEPGDRILLAAILESDGRPDLALAQYRELFKGGELRPAHLSTYVEFLLRQEDLRTADMFLNQFEQVVGQSNQYRQLRGQWLRASGREKEIEDLVATYAQDALQNATDESARVAVQLDLARQYASLGLPGQAASILQSVVAAKPEAFVSLAVALGQNGQADLAVKMCLDRRAPADAGALVAMCLALMSDPLNQAAFDQADPVLDKAVGLQYAGSGPISPQAVEILTVIAAVRHVQGQYDVAEQIYTTILNAQPTNSLAMNNLASVLAESNDPQKLEQATKLVQDAMKIDGESANLMDTLGFVLFRQGHWERAADCLIAAARRPTLDPRYCFHLALAYDRLKKPKDAARYLRLADQVNLKLAVLTPVERTLLEELRTNVQRAEN